MIDTQQYGLSSVSIYGHADGRARARHKIVHNHVLSIHSLHSSYYQYTVYTVRTINTQFVLSIHSLRYDEHFERSLINHQP
jgi:hypothetical protein